MKVGIIGLGRFGKLLANILKDDFELLSFDKEGSGNASEEEVLACDTIFYAVPIGRFREVLEEHAKVFSKDKSPRVLIDVLSVKVFPKQVFEELLPDTCEAMLTHPMFGPDSVSEEGVKGQRIVVDSFRAKKETSKFWCDFFEKKGLEVVKLSAEKHDKLAASSQGLAHFIGRVLDELSLEATEIDTLGAKKLLEIKEQTCNDSWELFTDLQTKNPYTTEMRVRLGRPLMRFTTSYSRIGCLKISLLLEFRVEKAASTKKRLSII